MKFESKTTESNVRLGAFADASGAEFALWSSRARSAAVRLFTSAASAGAESRSVPLEHLGEGLFRGRIAGLPQGALYKFVLDERELPDPYARFLPHGVHGPAQLLAPTSAPALNPPRPLCEWVIYELHIGTFTDEGTYRAALSRLAGLAELGVTVLELMPLAAFAGHQGWGYDGVAHFAPHAAYGTPAELREFVAAVHALGMAVILDVVYNHCGPSGNYLGAYSPEYFTSRIKTPWGDAPDFTEPHARAWVLDNARYWLCEFGFDGLRLDATHQLSDQSSPHILAELAELARALAPPRVLIAEDERNAARLITEQGLHALWADDFHHVMHTLLTGERDGYYAAFEPELATLARTIERGWLYEGQHSTATGGPRGSSAAELSAENLVYCLQNHDQIGNRPFGTRLSHQVDIESYCLASMLLLFLPSIPLLFMGQEWAASSPFLYFTDHGGELGRAISRGRREEFRNFAAFAELDLASIPDPEAPATFASSKLRWQERDEPEHRRVLTLYKALLRLRLTDPVLKNSGRRELTVRVENGTLHVVRQSEQDLRVLICNFGSEAREVPAGLRQKILASREDAGLPAKSAAIFATQRDFTL